jgi:predicted nucleic acid binding AN1-type Zn finger protein
MSKVLEKSLKVLLYFCKPYFGNIDLKWNPKRHLQKIKKNMKHTIDIKETIEYKKNYRVLLAVSIVAAFYVLGIIIVFI